MSDRELVAAAGKLKRIKRQGWLDAGIPAGEAESVADHSFRVAFIAAFIAPPRSASPRPKGSRREGGLDVLKMVRMALLHDLAEHKVGDLTPRSGVSRGRKARMEEETVRQFGNREVLSLWKEFDENISPEARLVHEADVLERVIQAKEYAARRTGKRLDRFWKGWRRQVRSARFRALMEARVTR